MTFQTTLKQALAASDQESVNSYYVEAYFYPTDLDATVVLEDREESRYEFDLQQLITVQDDGGALVTDIEGDQHFIAFGVVRPLREEDLL